MLRITPIPAFKDNIIWVLWSDANKYCAIVDPGNATPVMEWCSKNHKVPKAILITHHHYDHTAGVAQLRKEYRLNIYGPKEASHSVTDFVRNGNSVDLDFLDLSLQIIGASGHTLGHIAYYGAGVLFSGDILFEGGCGRVFEGTFEQMYNSLMRLAELPDETWVYCAHHCSRENLEFAHQLDPNNATILQRLQELPPPPTTLGLEKQINPFLRCMDPLFHDIAKGYLKRNPASEAEIFGALRTIRDLTPTLA